MPIVAISGPGGFGKSTLALRAAHELRADFPDEHLYVDLSGPVSDDHTTILLARFLRALGVSGSMIPDERAERAELYRSRLASKRLLLLDDVHSEQQVMPLLPGSPSCPVIVTSRIPKQQQTGTASRRKAPARPEPGHRRLRRRPSMPAARNRNSPWGMPNASPSGRRAVAPGRHR